MLIEIHGCREVDFPDAPYGKHLIEWKNRKADEYRVKFGLKDTDSILISVA